jgi:hypothetical protein
VVGLGILEVFSFNIMANSKNLVIFSEIDDETELTLFRNQYDKCVIILGKDTHDIDRCDLVVLSKDDITALIKELQRIKKEVSK